MKKNLFFITLFLFFITSKAQLYQENFNSYTPGSNLTGNGGWTMCATGTTQLQINGTNLTYPGYNSANTANSLYFNNVPSNLGGYCNTWAGVNSGSVYMAFLFRDSVIATAATAGDYFITIGSGWLNNAARVLFKSGGGSFQFGTRKSTGSDTYTSATYAPNQTHLVVLKYTFNTGTSTDDVVGIYVNPTLPGTEPASFTVAANTTTDFSGSIGNVFLRLNMSTANVPNAYIDAIKVTQNWNDLFSTPACNAVAGFTNVPNNLTVQFTNTSTGTFNKSIWNFGDGDTSTASNPSHTYTTAGSKNVCLKVYDASNNICDSICKTVTVTNPPCNSQSDFSALPSDLSVQFTNSSTGNFNRVLWNFGDGDTSLATSPSHTYLTAGSKNVCLSVFDAFNGFCDSTCKLITVNNPPCNALAIFSTIITNLNVQFVNNSTGNFNRVLWNFGDGDTSTASNPSHLYSTAGVKNICLSVYDVFNGFCDSTCKSVNLVSTGIKKDINKLNNLYYVNERVIFETPGMGNGVISLFDISGKKIEDVFNGEINPGRNEYEILSEITNGIYIVKAEWNNEIFVQKINILKN